MSLSDHTALPPTAEEKLRHALEAILTLATDPSDEYLRDTLTYIHRTARHALGRPSSLPDELFVKNLTALGMHRDDAVILIRFARARGYESRKRREHEQASAQSEALAQELDKRLPLDPP